MKIQKIESNVELGKKQNGKIERSEGREREEGSGTETEPEDLS